MTSIEWLIKELYTEMNMSGDGRVLDEILEEAKEMHKQEIIKAFDECQEYEYQYHINNAPKFDSETYYQETFVSKGSDDHISDISKMVDVPKQQETLYTEEQVNSYAEYCTTHVLTTQIGHPYLSVKEFFKQTKKD